MNEKMKKTMKRSLALMLALILVIGTGTWLRDGSLLADEEAPEARVVVEEAAPAEAPAPAPVEEPVVVVQQVELTPEPPAAAEPAAEEKQEAEAEQQVEEPAPAEEPVVSEEEQEAEQQVEEASEDDADASFDVEEACEYYMSLASDEEKQEYLDSLADADRAALEAFIALNEPAADETAEEPAVMLAAAAPDEEAEAEPVAAEDGVLDVPEQGEEAEAEAEAEAEPEVQAAPTAFGSMKVSGEWAGRSTSSRRAINIEVYVDGALADVCYAEMNMSVANFSVAIGDCTIDSVNSTCGAFTGSNGSYSVDMYADTNVTVTVNLSSPVVEIEEEPAEESEETAFDAAKLYEELIAMTEEEAMAIVGTLSEEEYAALEAYANNLAAFEPEEEEIEEAEEEEFHKIVISASYEGELGYGTIVTLKGDVVDYNDEASLDYIWEESYDGGKTWKVVEGVTGLTYTFELTHQNAGCSWRVSIA